MGPKAKGKKKEKKKSEEGKGAAEDNEFDQMEIEELRETVAMYQNQLNDITFKRNFLQIEMVSCYSMNAILAIMIQLTVVYRTQSSSISP